MQTITPHLWFDHEAKEAATFYTSLFPDSRVLHVTTLHGVPSPSGKADVVSFELAGQPFMAISAGPEFKFNPLISFILNFDPSKDKQAKESLDRTWKQLSPGGSVLMELGEYPFSKRYGWLQDKYGLSWQLILSDPGGEERPFITTSILFTGNVCGKAEEAINFYLSVFKDSKRGITAPYPEGMEPEKPGTIMFADFRLGSAWFAAMDSAQTHNFKFNEAVSLLIPCDTQEEIDYFWKKLSADPASEQCGWLKDKYGVSWQVSAAALNEMMKTGSRDQIDRLTQAFLPMKKFDIRKLREAFEGKKSPAAIGHA
ncbi:MAG TPA: VOC family protein [Chryseosolibacter sp.]|nr:VOC family protein [Chryseosolibacter sp.]